VLQLVLTEVLILPVVFKKQNYIQFYTFFKPHYPLSHF
jgi:hypothetical protein